LLLACSHILIQVTPYLYLLFTRVTIFCLSLLLLSCFPFVWVFDWIVISQLILFELLLLLLFLISPFPGWADHFFPISLLIITHNVLSHRILLLEFTLLCLRKKMNHESTPTMVLRTLSLAFLLLLHNSYLPSSLLYISIRHLSDLLLLPIILY